MVSRGTFYGIVVVLVALLLLTSFTALNYYNQYQSASSAAETRAVELGVALAKYDSLAGQYNSSLNDDYTTMSLLAQAVGNLNTSTPAYRTASGDLSTLWQSYQSLVEAGGGMPLAYRVHMLLDYGNGTLRWYNDSTAQPSWNAYVVSLVLLGGNLNATWYPEFGEHLVSAINGVPGTASLSWSLWEYSDSQWTYSQVGADQVQIQNGTTIAWALCGYNSSYQPTCTP
jgi:hypothetical protein